MTTWEFPEDHLPPAPTHELCRWGQPYLMRGSRGEVIKQAERFDNRPWWWLRLLGWHVRPIEMESRDE